MKVYTKQHRYDCGIDLNAGTMYDCILDAGSEIVKSHKRGRINLFLYITYGYQAPSFSNPAKKSMVSPEI